MAASFKIPSSISQDLAIIMGFVDPPEPPQELLGWTKSPNPPPLESDNDIASSGTESEDEVEAQIEFVSGLGRIGQVQEHGGEADALDKDVSDADSLTSSSSCSSSPQRRKGIKKMMPALDVDFEDDPSIVTAYVPTAHELAPAAIPVPPLPNPLTLPQGALQFVGEITNILPDGVVVRGGDLSDSRPLNMREKRNVVLDEGSLLVFDDRTPLGYVWETFGPTTLPHYLVRLKHGEVNRNTASESHPFSPKEPVQPPTIIDTKSAFNPASTTPRSVEPDPAKLSVFRAIYHIPSLSNFVFPSALAKLKGSDASNIHDEEPAENELEFSDDEAEAAHKRPRKPCSSRTHSQIPVSRSFDDHNDDSMSTVADDVGSLYGVSPYDFEDPSASLLGELGTPSSPSGIGGASGLTPSTARFEDSAVRGALILARTSRNRRLSLASEHGSQLRGQGRDRRGKDRGRNSRSHARDRGRGRGVAQERPDHGDTVRDRGSSFSFEEYDPHMPRPPSPTSLAIARAIGQWADGTPYPYESQTQGHYDLPTTYFRTYEHDQFQAPPYGVAPHINPMFAHAFGISGPMRAASPTPPMSFSQESFPLTFSQAKTSNSSWESIPDQNTGHPTAPSN